MRHYEIMLIIHPDQSEQVPGMMQRYEEIIKKHDGKIHRKEDIGRRQLAYPISKVHKGHYILMNIECNNEVRSELENSFKFNDAILRKLILKRSHAITTESMLMKKEKDKDGKSAA